MRNHFKVEHQPFQEIYQCHEVESEFLAEAGVCIFGALKPPTSTTHSSARNVERLLKLCEVGELILKWKYNHTPLMYYLKIWLSKVLLKIIYTPLKPSSIINVSDVVRRYPFLRQKAVAKCYFWTPWCCVEKYADFIKLFVDVLCKKLCSCWSIIYRQK